MLGWTFDINVKTQQKVNLDLFEILHKFSLSALFRSKSATLSRLSFCVLFSRLKVIVDHMAKPSMKTEDLEKWEDGLKALADLPNVYCKM